MLLGRAVRRLQRSAQAAGHHIVRQLAMWPQCCCCVPYLWSCIHTGTRTRTRARSDTHMQAHRHTRKHARAHKHTRAHTHALRCPPVPCAACLPGQMRAAPSSSPMAPTVHAYTAAMRAATEGGRWARALDIWGDLRSSGCAATGEQRGQSHTGIQRWWRKGSSTLGSVGVRVSLCICCGRDYVMLPRA